MDSQPPAQVTFSKATNKLFDRMIPKVLKGEATKDMIVFSHLRWEFVKQRPQHLLERLAVNRRILFIEEPIEYTKGKNKSAYGSARTFQPARNILVVQPRIDQEDVQTLSQIVQSFAKHISTLPVVWLYSASFIDVALNTPHSAMIYDCMDELSQFLGAPKKLILQEHILLKHADVVFTGGKSLFESKQSWHDNIYCFPSSVDRKHFEKALQTRTRVPDDLKKIHQPIVGYYGVIDERINLKLLEKLAKLMPKVAFVMIGPVVKVDPAALPKQTNIHYLGSKDYSELPAYLKGFDVAFMPFALNEATEYISPTKTLEFMAAGKPIVSTPIRDVQRDYSREVSIASTASQIQSAIQSYLEEKPEAKKLRQALQKAVIEKTSWDNTAKAMSKLIDQAVAEASQLTVEADHKGQIVVNSASAVASY